MHALESHIKEIKSMCLRDGLDTGDSQSPSLILPYDVLITLVSSLLLCLGYPRHIVPERFFNERFHCSVRYFYHW